MQCDYFNYNLIEEVEKDQNSIPMMAVTKKEKLENWEDQNKVKNQVTNK